MRGGVCMRPLYRYERVLLAVWVNERIDLGDPAPNQQFADCFKALFEAYYDDHDESSALHLATDAQQLILERTIPGITLRQLVRFRLLFGLIVYGVAKSETELDAAVVNLSLAQKTLRAISGAKDDAYFEVTRWLALAYRHMHQHQLARGLFDELITMLPYTASYHFIRGDHQWLSAELHTSRAVTRMALVDLDGSQRDVDVSEANVLRYLSEYRQGKLQVLSQVAEHLRDRPTQPLAPDVPLAALFTGTPLNEEQSIIAHLLEIHCMNSWQTALIKYHRENILPAPDPLTGYQDLEYAYNVLTATIALCQMASPLAHMIPSMYRVRTDIALLLTDYQWHVPALRMRPIQWLQNAKHSLDEADRLDPTTGVLTDSQRIGQLTLAKYEMLRLRIQQDIAGLVALRVHAKELCDEAIAANGAMSNLVARGHILLGEISETLGELRQQNAVADFAQARQEYEKAFKIFIQANNDLRIKEVSRLLKDLP
jgi:hypothetical protein